jgi:hypothetical protein
MWEDFCSWTVTRFGRNRHQALLRQLYHIHQFGSMVDYVNRFAELIDQLSTYNIHIDTIHYTTRFIDGLKQGRIYQVGFVRLKPTLHFQ